MNSEEYNSMPLPNRKIYDLVREHTGGNVSAFASGIGVTHQSLSRLFRIDPRNGKFPSVSQEIKMAIFDKYGLDEVWLITHDTPQETDNVGTERDNTNSSPYFDNATIQGGGANGTGSEVFAIERAAGFLNVPGLPTGSDIPYIKVRGNSMVNHTDPALSIPAGSWIGLRRCLTSAIRWGEVYAFQTLDGPIVKILRPSELGEDYVLCVSYNEQDGYLPFDLHRSEIVGSLYDVVSVLTIQAR